jgi:hypothetical protein
MLPLLLLLTQAHQGDVQPLLDPMRPVTRIARDSFTLQYYTAIPCETKIELRRSDIPQIAYKYAFNEKRRIIVGPAGKRTFHRLNVSNLEPGKRYFYRTWDPNLKPTAQEKSWGSEGGWRREFAVSTLAPTGQKTIIHLPVKVLLMPNVINVASAHDEKGVIATPPPKITAAEIEKIKGEFKVSSRFFWVNSGMRLWVDYQFFVDDRWQRWSPEPANADAFYRGWPASRSYPGKDYADPGGGDFTIVDTKDPLKISKEPIYEAKPYSHQVEMAWPRRWNAREKKWEFYNSGGGTFGVDAFPQGFPGRTQFLGGGDTAWLATHEVHHGLESSGTFSLSNREDERIVFNHYTARRRIPGPNGAIDEVDWTTSGRHGEHWDGMAFWDRTLSDAQWLRMYFGYTVTVKDADGDGVPDDDPRLPLDEKRFGSSPMMPKSDGVMADLDKVMLSTWVPGPLQPSWIKPPFQGIKPNPKAPDTDADGQPDISDPYPLYPWRPFIYPVHANVDGDISEWTDVPNAGTMSKGGITATWKQAHDHAGYYGMLRISGPWQRAIVTLDGEGLGVYSGVGVQGIELTKVEPTLGAAGPQAQVVQVKATFQGAPGLKLQARGSGDATFIEFKLPNRGEGRWFWTRGGREIGSIITIEDTGRRLYSMYEPYRPFYALMLEPHGQNPLPSNPPTELTTIGVQVLKPSDPKLKVGAGWKLEGGALRSIGDDESVVSIEGLNAREFDLWVELEAKSDGIVGGFVKGQKEMDAGRDYIGFVGGYGNTATRMRLFGREEGEESVVMSPGRHRIQMTRRGGEVWLLMDGKPLIWAPDPNPKVIVDRLAILGGYGGQQVVHEIRYRAN